METLSYHIVMRLPLHFILPSLELFPWFSDHTVCVSVCYRQRSITTVLRCSSLSMWWWWTNPNELNILKCMMPHPAYCKFTIISLLVLKNFHDLLLATEAPQSAMCSHFLWRHLRKRDCTHLLLPTPSYWISTYEMLCKPFVTFYGTPKKFICLKWRTELHIAPCRPINSQYLTWI